MEIAGLFPSLYNLISSLFTSSSSSSLYDLHPVVMHVLPVFYASHLQVFFLLFHGCTCTSFEFEFEHFILKFKFHFSPLFFSYTQCHSFFLLLIISTISRFVYWKVIDIYSVKQEAVSAWLPS